jgi:signal transduction histidine kinase
MGELGSLEMEAKYISPPDMFQDKADKVIQVDFIDQGPGLKAGTEDQIFEPFFTTRSKGVGLGLAIVKRIISAHDGEVLAETLPSGGAKFSVYLPALESPYSASARSPGTKEAK